MYSYFGYGLNIQSVLPLPELLPTNSPDADVVIRRGHVEYSGPKHESAREYCSMAPQEAFLYWEEYGTFLVSEGREIVIDPHDDIEDSILRLLLLGAGLAVLLHQRGLYVMHASAVGVENGAIAFLGPKGYGKSSMAAAFYANGHRLLADDLVAVDLSDPENPMVVPGFPQVKLWPEAAASVLEDNPEDLPMLASGYEKRGRLANEGFTSNPTRLRCMYMIGEDEELGLSRMSPQDAISDLIGNSYIARFGKNALHGTAAALHLRQSVNLVNQVPVFSLNRPDSLSTLPHVVKTVVTHAAAL